MFDHLTTLMTLQYVKDKVMGEEQAFITMEMCHRVLTSKWTFSCFHTNLSFSSVILNGCCLPPHCVMYAVMNYSIDREFEGHIFERMLAVFTLMFGMEGSQKLVRKLSTIRDY